MGDYCDRDSQEAGNPHSSIVPNGSYAPSAIPFHSEEGFWLVFEGSLIEVSSYKSIVMLNPSFPV